jgi:aspartate racemase
MFAKAPIYAVGVVFFAGFMCQGCEEEAKSANATYIPDASRVLLGIGGGVGPMAGVGLHIKVIENTITDGTDQTHFTVHHLSQSEDLLDRTKFLNGEITENPGNGMAKVMSSLQASTMEYGGTAVAGVPCNTFHAPAIWDQFVLKLQEENIDQVVKVVHMLEETVSYIKESVSGVTKIGLMSTTGTRNVRVYHELLESDYTVIEVPWEMQDELHDSIYNTEWGIKAQSSPVTQQVTDNFNTYVNNLIEQGAQAVILGCTEIPLVLPERYFNGTDIPLVDPVDALARAMIREANADKLKALRRLL